MVNLQAHACENYCSLLSLTDSGDGLFRSIITVTADRYTGPKLEPEKRPTAGTWKIRALHLYLLHLCEETEAPREISPRPRS